MQAGRRWSFIPQTKALCVIWIVVGALLLSRPIWKLADTGTVGVFDVIAAIAAAALIVCSVVGLVSPRLRGR